MPEHTQQQFLEQEATFISTLQTVRLSNRMMISFSKIKIILGEAILIYQPDKNILQPTELRVPVQWRYKDGLEVAISPRGLASWNFKEPVDGPSQEEAESTIEIHLDQTWGGEELSLVITPTR